MSLETRISESGPYGVLVELHPYGSDGLFLYGHPEDKLFQLEYPKGFKHSWSVPYHCSHFPGRGFLIDDPRALVDCEVRREAFQKAREYAKTLGHPVKIWDSRMFKWFEGQ
jgi:hypothetical protein